MIGQLLNNRYRITAPLGRGAMGMVYRATDIQTNQEVALKLVAPELTLDHGMLERFRREGESLRQLRHRNIVAFVDMFEFENKHVIVMEFMAGGSLHNLLRQGALPVERARQIALDLCDALTSAHRLNIIHRDLKPENVLMAQDGTPKLTDFGVARLLSEGTRLTGTGAQVGTPYYMSPEAWEGKALDTQADIWSLGVMLFEMLAGEVPFSGDTMAAVMTKVLMSQQPPDLRRLRPEVPPALVKIIQRMLARDKAKRYASMREVALDLERVGLEPNGSRAPAAETARAQGQSLSTVKAPPAPPAATPSKGWRSSLGVALGVAIAAVVILVGLIAAGGVGYWLVSSANRSNQATQTAIAALPIAMPQASATPAPSAAEATATPLAPTDTPHPTASPSAAPQAVEPTSAPQVLSSADPSTLVYLRANDVDTLDPALDFEPSGAQVIQHLYDTLVFFKRESPTEFIPQLALEVPTLSNGGISADGKTYTFQIRKGVVFHDGTPLQPADVAYTFQRALLQGGSASPQWLFYEAFFGTGVGDITQLSGPLGALTDDREALKKVDPAKLKEICQKVTKAIVADASRGTVTFKLAQPWGPFLVTLASPWGSVMSQQWVAEHGGWDGDCATWQNFYAPTSEEINKAGVGQGENGTGPFTLDHWTPGVEIVLTANDAYWRTEPAWPEGPVGAPRLKKIVIKQQADRPTRLEALQNGEADFIWGVVAGDYSALDALVGETCTAEGQCKVIDEGKPLRVYQGLASATRYDVFMNFKINTEGDNAFIGSGKLDGNGIPPDFFSDIHIRRAFNYCFDWNKYADEALNGEAIQSTDLMLPGMIGHEPNGRHYTYDPEKCTEEFKASRWTAADSRSLWEVGFKLSIPYNTNSVVREAVVKILQANIAAVNSKFVVEIIGMPSASYLPGARSGKFPIFVGGWIEDLHDPHDWLIPYLAGIYSARQNLPQTLIDTLKPLVDQGVSETEPVKRAEIYHQLNQKYFDAVPTILLSVPLERHYEQRWVQGYYHNVSLADAPAVTYFYALWKK